MLQLFSAELSFQFSGRNRHSLPGWGCLWQIRSGAQGACHGAVCCAVCFHGHGMKNAGKTLQKPWKGKGKPRFFFLKGQKNRTLRLLKLPCVSLFSRANTEVQHLIIFVIGFLLCLVSPYAKKNRIPSRVARSVIGWRTIS